MTDSDLAKRFIHEVDSEKGWTVLYFKSDNPEYDLSFEVHRDTPSQVTAGTADDYGYSHTQFNRKELAKFLKYTSKWLEEMSDD